MRSDKEFAAAVMERRCEIMKKRRSRIRAAVSAVTVFAVTVTVLTLYPWKKIPEADTTAGGVDMENTVTDSAPDMFYGTLQSPISPEDVPDGDKNDGIDSIGGEAVYGDPTKSEIYYSTGDTVILDSKSAARLLSVIEDCFEGGTWYKDVSTESAPDLILAVRIEGVHFEIFSDTSVRKNGTDERIIGEDGVSKILAVIENITAE